MPRYRSMQGKYDNCRLMKLELENQALSAKLDNLEKNQEKFINKSKNLDVMFGRQRPKSNTLRLEY